MADNLAIITEALRDIQQKGGEDNFVIFSANEQEYYYIQFAARCGESRLYAEASSNKWIPETASLSDSQITKLADMGWIHPTNPHRVKMEGFVWRSPNFFREWYCDNDDDRQRVAQEVMRTFVDVYNVSPEKPLEVTLVLE